MVSTRPRALVRNFGAASTIVSNSNSWDRLTTNETTVTERMDSPRFGFTELTQPKSHAHAHPHVQSIYIHAHTATPSPAGEASRGWDRVTSWKQAWIFTEGYMTVRPKSKIRPRRVQNPPRASPKPLKIQTGARHESSDATKSAQNACQRRPRDAQERPKAAQEGPERHPYKPESTPNPSKNEPGEPQDAFWARRSQAASFERLP